MANYGLPKNEKVLAAIGSIALRHGQLDNALKMLIKDLSGLSEPQVLDATAMQGSRELRERARKLAKQRVGEGAALIALDAILQRARLCSEGRNNLLHSTWGVEAGKVVVRDARHEFQKMPTIAELASVTAMLENLIIDINFYRREGLLAEALKKKLL